MDTRDNLNICIRTILLIILSLPGPSLDLFQTGPPHREVGTGGFLLCCIEEQIFIINVITQHIVFS